MCLILFAYRQTLGQPLIVAANRDEFYARPSAAAHWWDDAPGLLAGRDLQAGGTWLGVQANGRFAAVTNFTDPDRAPPPRSRGALVADFLRSAQTSVDYAADIQGDLYQGFNLLLWDGRTLACASNRVFSLSQSGAPLTPQEPSSGHREVSNPSKTVATQTLEPGCYALTNAELGARWPKAVDGLARLRRAIAGGADLDGLIGLMRHDQLPEGDADLPATQQAERARGLPGCSLGESGAPSRAKLKAPSETAESRATPCFIRGEAYGTRASTAVVCAEDGSVALAEQSYGPQGALAERHDFHFEALYHPTQ